MPEHSRRELLQTSGTALGLALSGCSALSKPENMTAAVRWRFDTTGITHEPIVNDETVYVGSENRGVYAVEPP